MAPRTMRPVAFVIHGVKRDADRYFEEWRPFAERRKFVIVVSAFPSTDFPGARAYSLGGMSDERGAAVARQLWAYSAIEPMFDEIRARLQLSADQYVLYGHSAGAQFAHRFAMFGAGARARMAIAANAGWHRFPDQGQWPYGPRSLPAGIYDPAIALTAPLVVLAGEADIDPVHPSLRRAKQANAQGKTRYERAHALFAAGAAYASANRLSLGWSCVTAPGVGHNDAEAAPSAGQPCARRARESALIQNEVALSTL